MRASLRALLATSCFTLVAATSQPASAQRPTDTPAAEDGETPDVPTEYFVEEHAGFRIAYHPAARERVREVVPLLAPLREELSAALGVPVLEQVELRVAALAIEVPRLAPAHALALPVRGGISFPERGLIVVSLGNGSQPGSDLEAAIRHHLVHLGLEGAAPDADIPAWFAEGFAAHFASDGGMAQLTQLELATLSGDPPSLGELAAAGPNDRSRALAADFIRFTSQESARMPAVFNGLRRGLPFDQALEDAFAADASTIERSWRRDTLRRYGVYPLIALLLALSLCALLVRHLRRRRRLRKPSTARHVLRLRSRLRARRQETKLRIPIHIADHELPRVEHDGDWHTLH